MFTDRLIIALAVVIPLLVTVALTVGIYQDVQRKNRLFTECMLDHKEYECEAMLNGGRPDAVTTPMIIHHN